MSSETDIGVEFRRVQFPLRLGFRDDDKQVPRSDTRQGWALPEERSFLPRTIVRCNVKSEKDGRFQGVFALP